MAGAVFASNGADFVDPRNVKDVSYVLRINHKCYFVVQSSTGVVLYSTEKYWSSTL